jgi:hypothetical protein
LESLVVATVGLARRSVDASADVLLDALPTDAAGESQANIQMPATPSTRMLRVMIAFLGSC